jgi:hypothetical protein
MKVKKSPGLAVGTIILSEANLSRSWHRTGFSGQYLFVVSQGFFNRIWTVFGFSKDRFSAGFGCFCFFKDCFSRGFGCFGFSKDRFSAGFGCFGFRTIGLVGFLQDAGPSIRSGCFLVFNTGFGLGWFQDNWTVFRGIGFN